MDTDSTTECPNLVAWTLSGKYDRDRGVLFDANGDRFITLQKAHDLVAALAGAFDADSTVCLHLTNDILYPILTLGILASNCRWTGTNTAYTAAELEHHFRISNTKYVITSADYIDTVRAAVSASGTNAEIIRFVDIVNDPFPPVKRNSDGVARPMTTAAVPSAAALSHRTPTSMATHSHVSLAEQHRTDSVVSVEVDTDPNKPRTTVPQLRNLRDLLNDPTDIDLLSVIAGISSDSIAVLMQTSGTTGLPKMAARTHRSMVLEQQSIEDNNADKDYRVRRLYCAPIFHGFSFPEMAFNALRLGQESFFMKRYDDSFAQKIHDFRITETMGAPPMLRLLVKDTQGRHLLQSLRMISFGGAALGPELRKMTLDMFERKPRLVPVYGMTEGGWFTTLKYPETDGTGSVGRPIAGYEVKVGLMDGLTDVKDGEKIGEVLVRGPQLMTCYLGNAQATREAFTADGWLKTGDIGYVRDGKVYLVDRAKDLIKVNGWQVAPAELEDVAMQSEHVRDVAVFGVGTEDDEHPMACVVAKKDNGGHVVTAEMIKAHLRGRLTGYKVNRCEVRFVLAIPKSPAGKILKKVMKEQLAAGTLA